MFFFQFSFASKERSPASAVFPEAILVERQVPKLGSIYVGFQKSCTPHENEGLKLAESHKKMSQEKIPPTFHYTGWLIGILTMVYYNPYITG